MCQSLDIFFSATQQTKSDLSPLVLKFLNHAQLCGIQTRDPSYQAPAYHMATVNDISGTHKI
jgi:hypothetical protein